MNNFSCSKSSCVGTWVLFIESCHLHCSLQLFLLFDSTLQSFLVVSALLPYLSIQTRFKLIPMYLSILAFFLSLISYALANGCHTDLDAIGCPNMMAICNGPRHRRFLRHQFPDDGSSYHKSHQCDYELAGPDLLQPADLRGPLGNFVSLWANFRINTTSNGAPYTLDYNLCISLLEQASTGNGTTLHGGMQECTNTIGNGLAYGGFVHFATRILGLKKQC